jgi:hypothetical protein
MNSRSLEDANRGSPAFGNFDFRLRQFISDTFPEEYIKFEDTIRAGFFFSLLYVTEFMVFSADSYL